MQTTAPTASVRERVTGAGPLARALVLGGGSALLAGLVVVLVALIVADTDAALGALTGTMIAFAVYLTGALVLHMVATVMPGAALAVAMMTFVLQVMVLALVMVKLSESGFFADDAQARGWLAAALIAGTLAWCVGQIRAVTHARTPIYDLPGPEPQGGGR